MPPPLLPFDIHARIIEFVYILSQSHEIDLPTLSACALVCKGWIAPAQRLLFRRIRRPSNSGYDTGPWFRHVTPLLLRAFTSHPHLGTYVRSITLEIVPSRLSAKTCDALWLSLLRLCPHIARLRFVGSASPPAPWLQDLCALGLRPSVLIFALPVAREVVHAMLATLPSVRHLVVEQTAGDLLDFVIPPSVQLLSVTCDSAINFKNLCVVPGPVPPKDISFEDLHVHHLYLPEEMTSIERCVARNLRSLTIWMVPSSDILKQLTALESLVLNNLPSQPTTLPRTLRHFGLHAHRNHFQSAEMAQSIKELPASLSENAVPDLRVVSVIRLSDYAVRQTLEEASAVRGADFVVYASRAAYPRARYVDWIW
ncbi:hypothetical protein FA95DRAFT_1603921 [Auriscalpium vulgare]|uniref:Uncharacterized protein n=1 Tax=Auriscalpium vulgare TaxID=40419 RepID=A0ACB8S211_9AGAM|nr:hypothetical protein FA95DRAFT_1603921 [Auriscalpium vulgare]